MINFKANLHILALFFAIAAVWADFDYCNQGYWVENFKTCAGRQQSPIELNLGDVLSSALNFLPALRFENYDIPYELPAKIENNGQTVNIELPKPKNYIPDLWRIYDMSLPHITGGGLPNELLSIGRFVAESIHFHWGSSNSHGSEHVLNGNRYSMEMHIVHRNSKYPTVAEAINHSDGLAVIGIMYDVVAEHTHSRALTKIVNVMDQLRNFNDNTEINNFKLGDFIGEIRNLDFFSYSGSLTTPNCAEVVTWHVFDSPVEMSYSQMDAFRALVGAYGVKLENNYRALQVKDNRPIRWHTSVLTNTIDAANIQKSPDA